MSLHLRLGGISFDEKECYRMRNVWTLTELKEIILSILALFWGAVFLLPGEILSQASRVDLLRIYAGDATWGVLLLTGSLFLLFSPRDRYFKARKYTHAFFWVFWVGISTLLIARSVANGFNEVDALICSPFITLAFLHAAFYVRLTYVK